MNKLGYFFFAFVIFLADQVSKWAVTQYMIKPALGDQYGAPLGFVEWMSQAGAKLPFVSIEHLPFFNIVMVWNEGVSFGLFNDGGEAGVLFLMGLTLAIMIFFVFWMFKAESKFQLIAISMVIGGAMGNLIDRARFGAVVDFLDFHIGNWHYPAFNVSDSCIVIGVLLLMTHSFFFENKENNAR